MFNCRNLQVDRQYFFRGSYLTFQGKSGTSYLFKTKKGTSKKLSEKTVRQEVWEEINLNNLEAFNE